MLRHRLFQTKSTLQTKTKKITTKILSLSRELGIQSRDAWQEVMSHSENLLRLPDHRTLQPSRIVPSLAAVRAGKRIVGPYIGLMLISAFVVLGNQANQRVLAAASNEFHDDRVLAALAPETIEAVLQVLDPLTPELREEPALIASSLIAPDESYVSRPQLAVMAEAEVSSRRDPIPYTIQQGDTLVSIAKDNGRSVATILDANSIRPEDAGKIKPGATLLIPQDDTSQSLAWLEADQRVKAEAVRIAAAERAAAQSRARSSSVAKAAGTTSRQQTSAGFSGQSSGGFIVPINHNGISRGLGRGHTGIDYRANVGTTVVAAANGRVTEITHGWSGGWGISVVLDHGGGQTSRYAHLSNTAVGLGESVGQGQALGYSGNTGRSTGPHLHFEVRSGGRAVTPF